MSADTRWGWDSDLQEKVAGGAADVQHLSGSKVWTWELAQLGVSLQVTRWFHSYDWCGRRHPPRASCHYLDLARFRTLDVGAVPASSWQVPCAVATAGLMGTGFRDR